MQGVGGRSAKGKGTLATRDNKGRGMQTEAEGKPQGGWGVARRWDQGSRPRPKAMSSIHTSSLVMVGRMREGMRGRWEGGNSTHTAASTARDTNSALDTAAEPTWGGLHSKARGGGGGAHRNE